jgi:hypothetical protein
MWPKGGWRPVTSTTRTVKETDREETAERLLKSSASKFYDPDVDIDC